MNLNDYANSARPGEGSFGSTNMEELNQLQKALEAGQITGRETANSSTASGAPLKVESLDKNLKNVTYSNSDIVFYKRIPKKMAFNTVEEYNQQTSYGTDRGGFYREGELPNEEDSIYVRRSQLVKFLGITKSVSHPMTLVNTMASVGNIVQKQIEDGTLWMLRKINTSLYFGDEAIIPEEFNSILAQQMRSDAFANLDAYFASECIVDMRGFKLSESAIEDAANGIIQNFGVGNQLYAPPTVMSNFVKNFYGNKFIVPNSPSLSAGIMGQNVQAFDSQFGRIGLNWDIFFNKKPSKKNTTAANSIQAPATPTVTAAAVASDASSKWASTDAGAYFYGVSAVNRFGESAMGILGAAVTIVTGGSVDLTVTDNGGTFPASGYVVYRSNKGAASAAVATFYPLYTVSKAEFTAGYDGGAAGVLRDRNRWMPNCDQAFLVQENNEVMEFAQLAPLMKMDLAILSPAYRFMILMYGTPFLYAPKKLVRIINIGTN